MNTNYLGNWVGLPGASTADIPNPMLARVGQCQEPSTAAAHRRSSLRLTIPQDLPQPQASKPYFSASLLFRHEVTDAPQS